MNREAVETVPEDHGGSGARVLIVDDHKTNLLKMSFAIKKLGHEAICKLDGPSALEVLSKGTIDIVLLDIVMPGMSGFEVLQTMKSSVRLRDIPVIVISSLDDDMDSVVRGIELGAEDFLPKDFDPILLKARVGAGIEKKRLRDLELEYLRQVDRLTKAAAVLEAGNFNPSKLGIQEVSGRGDALGKLARVFLSMAQQVYERERAFRARIATLRGGFILLAIGALYGLLTPLSRVASFSERASLGALVLDEPVGKCNADCNLPFQRQAEACRAKGSGVSDCPWSDRLIGGSPVVLGDCELACQHGGDDPRHGQFPCVRLCISDRYRIGRFQAVPWHVSRSGRSQHHHFQRPTGLRRGNLGLVLGGARRAGHLCLRLHPHSNAPADLSRSQCLLGDRHGNLGGTTLPIVWMTGDFATTADFVGDPQFMFVILMMTVIVTVGGVLTVVLTKSTGSVFASQCSYAITFFGIAWSVLLLRESISLWNWVGLALMVLGLAIVGPKQEAEPEPPAELLA